MFAGGAGGLISCPGLKSASTRAFDPWSDACDEPSEKYRAYCRKGHGLEKSDDLRALLCERKPRIYRFKDDGVVPNHPLSLATRSTLRKCSQPVPSTASRLRSTRTPGGSILIGGGIT